MRITLILFILPCFFNVLLASPLPGWSLPLRLHDILRHIVGPPKKFEGCTPEQEKAITEAEPHAVAYVKDSLRYLETYREDAPRFKEWFGDPSPEGWKTLQTLFQNMDKHISHGVYVCSKCKGDKYIRSRAYVKPGELGRVYICPSFWKRRLVGLESKASIIVHEWSHFKVIGDTRDIDETVFGCLHNLPKNQGQALKNAYSIQYFAENFPPLD